MNDATPELRHCEVCGDPIRAHNKEGICSRTPECHRLRMRKRREPFLLTSTQGRCKICGTPLSPRNRTGICNSRKRPECRLAARRELRRDKTSQPYRIAIKAGDRFGLWTALEDYSLDSKTVLVRCDCVRRTERRLRGSLLVQGHSQSCGCTRSGPIPSREPYLTAGSVYGRLTVLEDVRYNNEHVRCQCACGTGAEVAIIATSVKLGLTKSCGCLSRERATRHGFTGHPLSQLWRGIIQRCTNPNSPSYYNYGGRGITICERWLDPWAFAEDILSEIGPRPEGTDKRGRALYSFDRIDNERGYEPGNVRWATRSEQIKNQRKVSQLTQDVLRLTRERDALAARVATLEAALARTSGT
jgi:hypothetical protein